LSYKLQLTYAKQKHKVHRNLILSTNFIDDTS